MVVDRGRRRRRRRLRYQSTEGEEEELTANVCWPTATNDCITDNQRTRTKKKKKRHWILCVCVSPDVLFWSIERHTETKRVGFWLLRAARMKGTRSKPQTVGP